MKQHGEAQIREALKEHDIYPVGEINACQIYKTHEGWQIQKFGEQPWNAGDTIEEALEAIKEIAEGRKHE